MKLRLLTFKELSLPELYDIMKLRQDVFIIEQNCIFPDIDGYDKKARHLILYDGEKLAAYLRLFAPGIKYADEVSLGRIIVEKTYRGTGTGRLLIETGIEYSVSLFGTIPIRIEAQSELREYYNTYGFKEEGEVYIVDGIPHLQMVYQPRI